MAIIVQRDLTPGGIAYDASGPYPLAVPSSPAPRNVRITPRAMTQLHVSPFGGSQQAQLGPEWWEAEIELPPMDRARAEPWLTFLAALRGRSGTFLIGDPYSRVARGSVLGTPLVDGAHSARAKTLAIKGWTASQTNILRAGDYVQVGYRLHKALQDANSDSSGNCSIAIFPALREDLADGAAVIVANCVGTFRLASDENSWSWDKDRIASTAFKAVEAI